MTINGTVYSYGQYLSWGQELVSAHKTSGKNQSENLIGFTALNLKRMERIDKTIVISEEISAVLKSMKAKQSWYLIAEFWCGDCAQNVPAIGKIAALSNGLIDLSIIQRDENPAWIDKYHTNGSKSVPKLISFNESGNELFTWGPRPQAAQMLLKAWKENPGGSSWDDFEKELHTWYAKDKAQNLQHELFVLLARSTEFDLNNNQIVHDN